MCDAWTDSGPVDLRSAELSNGLIGIGCYALEPLQAMQFAIELFHAAAAADERQRALRYASLPLFEPRAAPAPEVPRA